MSASPLRSLLLGLRSLLRKQQSVRELDDELGAYLEMSRREKMERGMSREEAERAVRLENGSVDGAREMVRASGWESHVESCCRDLRMATRTLRRAPGFAAVAVITLALGIGASTAIFSVVDAVLLRPLPYPDPNRLVRVWEQSPDGRRMNLSDPNFQDFRAQNETFTALAEYAVTQASVSAGGEPLRLDVAYVSGDFFKAMGVQPARGRAFLPEEQRLNGSPAVIVSHGTWLRTLGGVEDLARCRLRSEAGEFPVVGVMPPGFNFPAGVAAWVPRELEADTPSRTAHNFRGLGRLRDGVDVPRARANLSAIAHGIRSRYGKEVDLDDAAVVPLADAMVGEVRTALLTLLAAVGLLLIVACTNVAGLLLARTSARRRELAVRAALGAGRGRLMQQFLAEAFVLSLAGGALGVLMAVGAVRIFPALLPASLPRQEGIAVNLPVLLFAFGLVVAVAVALGAFAAFRAGRADLQEDLSAGSRSDGGTGGSARVRGFLVVGEIAATLVILVGAGLLGRSFLRLVSTSPGFRQENLITMQFSPPSAEGGADQAGGLARQVRMVEAIVGRLRAIPGVEGVGVTGALPVAGGDNLSDGMFLVLDGRDPPTDYKEFERLGQDPARAGYASYCVAGREYFQTMGIPLIRGRLFENKDEVEAPHVALISQSLARRRWPGEDPIGRTLEFGNMDGELKPLTIVGIVGDVRAGGLDAPPPSIIYVDYRQRGIRNASSPTLLVRSADAAAVASAARAVFQELAPEVPVKISSFAQEMGGWLSDRRFMLLLVGSFAAAALLLAAVGLYGVVAFSVARRTQEIGIRMALGARRGDVLRLVLGGGARLVVPGVILGTAASLAVTRLISSLLFGISATDPLTFAGVALLLAGVALLASYLPARRATRVDPLRALRYE
ncbi:MAG TPA: ABC transporter permease [Candidatus Polarisedimenticolia bacterium]|nr:ABC transporter permease [Candidatus Polarisedimenticolia bacterium]